MMEWTSEALSSFNAFCERKRADLLNAGSDPDEVFADWKALIEAHAKAQNQGGIPVEFLEVELAGLDTPLALETAAAQSTPKMESPNTTKQKARGVAHGIGTFLMWAFGVALPVIALAVEWIFGFCEQILFDPIPTWFHLLCIAFVPAVNAWVLIQLHRKRTDRTFIRRGSLLLGLVIGISAFYTVQFSFTLPFAAIWIWVFGVGLLPFAPLFALICAFLLRCQVAWIPGQVQRLPKRAPGKPMLPLWKTALPMFLLFVLLEISGLISLIYAPRVANPDAAQQAHAIRVIQRFGSEQTLLRNSYNVDPTSLAHFLAYGRLFGGPWPATYRSAYYRVTGIPYTAKRSPRFRRFGQVWLSGNPIDWDVGGDQVSLRIKDLYLSQSRLDGRIVTESGVAYLEWTMEFQNQTTREQEARALIELPPGAVVSRVTLWINDEPCEAAFGGRAQTKAAYQAVAVRQRRDPLLVTTAGPDRIFQQCFPVPAGGTMKTRIGITAPLSIRDAENPDGVLRLPAFLEQNFSAKTETHIWMESDAELIGASEGLACIPATSDASAGIRGKIETDETAARAWICTPVPAAHTIMIGTDARLPEGRCVAQSWSPRNEGSDTPEEIAVVLDGSTRMGAHRKEIEDILQALSRTTRVHLILADVEPVVCEDLSALARFRFRGGNDNIPALALAAEWSAQHQYAPILWLHTSQPLADVVGAPLEQAALFARGKLKIHTAQFGPGANRVSEKLASTRLFHPIPVWNNPSIDIPAFFQNQGGKWNRILQDTGEWNENEQPAGSSHIVRLWAAGEVEHLAASGQDAKQQEAVELAKTFHLVTSVSGAVVLETQAQYKAHNLEPVNRDLTPGMVPEPATLMLLFSGGSVLLLAARKRRNAA